MRQGSVGGVLAGDPDVRYDLVLLDPPYDLPEPTLAGVLARLVQGWLADDAMVVVERSARAAEPAWPEALERQEQRRYGDTVLWLARTRVAP